MMAQKQSGTTLVEMMIVVGILGLLTSVAFANIQGYRNKAQKYSCIANLRQIESLISLWAIDNGKNDNDKVEITDIIPVYLRSTPYCPNDADKVGYALNIVSEKPKCPALPESHFID